MSHRIMITTTLVSTFMLFASLPAWAARDAKETSHYGTFVSSSNNKLVMTDHKKKEHKHDLAEKVDVTLDGSASSLSELKAGMKLRVTTRHDVKNAVTRIEAIDKYEMFANTHDGKFISLLDNKITMTDLKDQKHSHAVAAETSFDCDGVACKASDLKPGMRIRVTTKPNDKNVATHVCAIEKDSAF